MKSPSLFRYCFPTFARLAEWLRTHFTRGGLVIVVAMVACGPVVVYPETPLFHLFTAFSLLMVVAGGIGFVMRPRITVQAKGLRAVHRDEPLRIELILENTAWSPAFDLEVSFHPGDEKCWRIPVETKYVPYIGIRESSSTSLSLVPVQRGVWAWPDLQVSSTFPLNLICQHRISRIPGELVVYPHYEPGIIDALVEGCDAGDALEWDCSSQQAGVTMFSGNREYLHGMYVRRWDYSSWARTGKPIVRVITDPPQSSATIVVDTTLDDKPTAEQCLAFEMMLSVAAGLGDRLVREGWTIDGFQVGGQKGPSVARVRSVSLETMLEALARARGTPNATFSEWADNSDTYVSDISPGSVVYVLFSRWDAAREAYCRLLERENLMWNALVIHEPPVDVPADMVGNVRRISPHTVAK